jgi:hypothetical protein
MLNVLWWGLGTGSSAAANSVAAGNVGNSHRSSSVVGRPGGGLGQPRRAQTDSGQLRAARGALGGWEALHGGWEALQSSSWQALHVLAHSGGVISHPSRNEGKGLHSSVVPHSTAQQRNDLYCYCFG